MDNTKLHDAFSPVVRKALADLDRAAAPHVGETRVEFAESSSMADIYHFVVPVKRDGDIAPTALDMIGIASALDMFSTFEEIGNTVTIDGIEWTIGDGDDSLAVQFDNGEFKIWVRTFRHGDE